MLTPIRAPRSRVRRAGVMKHSSSPRKSVKTATNRERRKTGDKFKRHVFLATFERRERARRLPCRVPSVSLRVAGCLRARDVVHPRACF